jgi:oligopeptide transport system substrate-binding protein
MAGLATHYETNAAFTEFCFFLRGNPNPRGVRLPRNADLPDSFLQARATSPDFVRAYWSDGNPITAYDFVYSWRRFMNPRTAAPFAFQLTLVKNGNEVLEGKSRPEELGVHAADEFTFVVDLRSSTPLFLEFITGKYRAVPMHAVEAARKQGAESTWTEPSHIVTSGPFELTEHRPYERIVLTRNPRYYDASLVGLDELTFLPVVNGTTVMNLYKTGEAAVTPGAVLPPLFAPVLSRKKDYHSTPAFATRAPSINIRRAPFDKVLLRYALNMAMDKKAVAAFYGPSYVPARSFTAPSAGYRTPASLKIDVDGRQYDVLSFDVDGARSLLARAGFPGGVAPSRRPLQVPYHFPILTGARPQAEIIEQQWLHNLNVGVKLVGREFNVHVRMVLERDYTGIADNAEWPQFLDPYGFLGNFPSDEKRNPSGWSDPGYAAELDAANGILNRSERMRKLAVCEMRLLNAMPFLPLFHYANDFLCKPFVRGLGRLHGDMRTFKYAWIDTNWRPR